MVFDHTPEPTPATEALAASSLDEVRGRQVHVSNTFLELGKHAEQFLIRVPDAAILIGCCTSSAHAAAAALAAGVAVICLDSVERDGSDALKWTTRAIPSSPPVHTLPWGRLIPPPWYLHERRCRRTPSKRGFALSPSWKRQSILPRPELLSQHAQTSLGWEGGNPLC